MSCKNDRRIKTIRKETLVDTECHNAYSPGLFVNYNLYLCQTVLFLCVSVCGYVCVFVSVCLVFFVFSQIIKKR